MKLPSFCAVVKPQTQAPGLGLRLLLVKPLYPPPPVPFYLTWDGS